MFARPVYTGLCRSDFAQECLEVAALKQLQHDVVRPSVKTDANQFDNVGMIELADTPRSFTHKTTAKTLSEGLADYASKFRH